MPFLEVEFPRTISYKAVGGPAFSTVVNAGLSGAEQRNQNWQLSRGKWRISLATPPRFAAVNQVSRQQFIDLLVSFFVNAAGKANSFRLYDHLDHSAAAQPMVVVPGTSNVQWQLQRARTIAGQTYLQIVSKPIASWTKQDQNGNNSGGVAIVDYQGHQLLPQIAISNITPAVSWVLDATTGIVTFNAAPIAPLATFSYHYPVRFDVDQLDLQVEPSAVGQGDPLVTLNSVPLVEVAPPNF